MKTEIKKMSEKLLKLATLVALKHKELNDIKITVTVDPTNAHLILAERGTAKSGMRINHEFIETAGLKKIEIALPSIFNRFLPESKQSHASTLEITDI